MVKRRNILIILQIILIGHISYSQSTDFYFKHIGLEEGLSQSNVNCIAQDSIGYMWFGTQEGLNRYNGYDFKTFKHKQSDDKSISDNYINVIYKDISGRLWVGTRGGLNQYNYYLEDWTRSNIQKVSNSNNVLSITEDQNGILWVGTEKELIFFNKNDNRWEHAIPTNRANSICQVNDSILVIGNNQGLQFFNFRSNTSTFKNEMVTDPTDIQNQIIQTVIKGEDGVYWIGTKSGLYRHNYFDKVIIFVDSLHSDEKDIRSLFFDKPKSELWIGTYGGGLIIYNTKTKNVIRKKSTHPELGGLSNNFVLSIFRSKSRIMWIGAQSEVNIFDPEKKPFYTVSSSSDANSINNNFIWSFYENDQGILNIGTDRGLNEFDPHKNIWRHYSNENSNLEDNTVRVICKRKNNANLWIGTKNGLYEFISDRKAFRSIKIPDRSNDTDDRFIKALHEDKNGLLWIGTNEGGLIKYNPALNVFSYCNFHDNDSCIGNNRILSFYQDVDGELWVGTFGTGLSKYDTISETFINFSKLIIKNDTVQINTCLSFQQIDSSSFWVGTVGNGLLKFDKSMGYFTENYTIDEGLPNNMIYGILKDKHDCLWLSTNNGVCKFDITKKQFWNFNKYDGLQSNEFNAGAYLKSKQGEMFFGGVNGFNHFYPDSIEKYNYKPPVIITSFSISVDGKPQNILNEPSFHENERIVLKYDENNFTIKFVTLHYPTPQKIKYKYRLVEIGKEDTNVEWQEVPYKNRIAAFYEVKHGKYQFDVISTNCDGAWEGNERNTIIEIEIEKPFWYTWWFYFAVLLFILTLIFISVFIFYKWKSKMHKEQEDKLEKKIKDAKVTIQEEEEEKQKKILEANRQQEKLDTMDKLIGWFSHETKTPLEIAVTGLTTNNRLLEKIRNNPDIGDNSNEFFRLKRVEQNSEIVLENIRHTNHIIKQLRVISLKQIKDDLRTINLQAFLEDLYEKLKYQREGKEIKLFLKGDVDIKTLSYPIALDQIFSNLFLNSFKHGFKDRKRGEIEIYIKQRQSHFEIEYSDSGKGIDKDVQGKIFIEFFSSIKGGEGTGLGMAITKTIIERDFQGSIRLKGSDPNIRTTFSFNLKRFDNDNTDDKV